MLSILTIPLLFLPTLTTALRSCPPTTNSSTTPKINHHTTLTTTTHPSLIHLDMHGRSTMHIGPSPLYFALERPEQPWNLTSRPDGSRLYTRTLTDFLVPHVGCDLDAEAQIWPNSGMDPKAARWALSDLFLETFIATNASFFIGELWSERVFVMPQRWEMVVECEEADRRLARWRYRVECPGNPTAVRVDERWCGRVMEEVEGTCRGELQGRYEELNVHSLEAVCDGYVPDGEIRKMEVGR
ncbi:hypothetical protein P152DRAFT_475975 [Eremomyces bilateralis CBS 781.70]|uniref:Uncharacterized protein n=1 Tax=Eremomyces bilateralis CBS 781.70 TaxID=1392243 RepID=A0A6G1FWC0_9PEZI|nr:uncharacterized protein P152DRAFT_475975 [Eremomyces bilateralis CBS 781.70]KAF1810137.1 hypothetical protein P152DRAFT_475975 [Eremomyces bilateralis CBS 781.70]